MNLASLPQTVVDALALETAVTALRLKDMLNAAGPSRAAALNALAFVFVDMAPHGQPAPETFTQALAFLASDRVVIDDGVAQAALAFCNDGTNPPNAADVMAEETL